MMTRALVGSEALEALRGTPFTKMTGSGNDFVVFSSRDVAPEHVSAPEVVRSICNRHNGIGADGVVILDPGAHEPAAADGDPTIGLRYFNSDGSLGELCGNATLCSTQLSVALGFAAPDRVSLATDSGHVAARLHEGIPEIDLAPVTTVRPALDGLPMRTSARRVGFALVGVPHVVILADALEDIDIVAAGRPIRQHATLAPAGANVNWVKALEDGRWQYRTYERGVEGETLACGTGAVACAILLTEWGLAESPVSLVTQSGKPLEVSLRARTAESSGDRSWHASLSGEGRVVFQGIVGSLG